VGNPLFDAVIYSLKQHSTGRTYAVACELPSQKPWTGFEFVFCSKPDLKILETNSGLANHAISLFTVMPLHLFFTCDGTYFEGINDLLAIRKQLKPDLKNHSWWNLTKDKAQLLPQAIGGSDWQDTVLRIYHLAKAKARQLFADRLGPSLEEEIELIAEQVRQLGARREESARDEIILLKLLASSINKWDVELDGLGFLSINEISLN